MGEHWVLASERGAVSPVSAARMTGAAARDATQIICKRLHSCTIVVARMSTSGSLSDGTEVTIAVESRRDPEKRRVDFLAAYEAVLAQWPIAVEKVDVRTAFGSTRIHRCGPIDGPPLVLLHGGGATSTVWFANVEELGRTHRVHAIDLIGDAGCSVPRGRRVSTRGDLMEWLDEIFVHLGLSSVRLCGHSYGGWLALSYAIHAPQRVSHLALLDPTDCFTGLGLNYRLHAIPLLARPGRERMRSFLSWETGGRRLDPGWWKLVALGSEQPKSRIVLPRRPRSEQLRATTVPTLILLAENSKAHNIGRLACVVRQSLPNVTVSILMGASHHSIPTENPQQLNRELTRHFA